MTAQDRYIALSTAIVVLEGTAVGYQEREKQQAKRTLIQMRVDAMKELHWENAVSEAGRS